MNDAFSCYPTIGGKKWAVRRRGAKRAQKLFADRAEAWGVTRALAKHHGATAFLHDHAARVVIRIEPGIDP